MRLQLEFDWSLAPAHNVIARMPGTERPDQWILRGNHHDAWVIGARDPISGLVGLMAEAKALGRLAREGLPPRRTVVYAAWDAEEPGLLGSTEWAEHHAEALREHAAVYINSDSNSRGFLRAGGSHALETLVNQVAGEVEDPQTGVSVGERLLAFRRVNGNRTEYERLQSSGRLRIAALGSGSDYSPFLQHLGVSSLNVGYGGEGSGGEYHTAFDTFDFFRRFVDPGAVYGAVLARTGLRLTLRLANADVLPFEFGATAATAGRYINEVADLADEERRKIERENELLDSAALRLAADPTKPFVEPEGDPPAPHLNFAPLRNAHDRLALAAKVADRALAEAVRSWRRGHPGDARRVGHKERAPADPERGSAASALVPASSLCAGHVHRLRCEDVAGSAVGDRAARLGRGPMADRHHRRRTGRLRGAVGTDGRATGSVEP